MSNSNLLDEVRQYLEDDSRTFRDNPLLTYFRLRKWFILVSALLVLVDREWLSYPRLAPALFLDGLPVGELKRWLTFFGLYLALHAILLLDQLRHVYWDDVTNRAHLHGAVSLRKAELAVRERKDALHTSVGDSDEEEIPYKPDAAKALRRAQDNLDNLTARYEEARDRIRLSEIGRDIIRVVPAFALLFWALLQHGAWAGLFSLHP